jgi:hypothetical protein
MLALRREYDLRLQFNVTPAVDAAEIPAESKA